MRWWEAGGQAEQVSGGPTGRREDRGRWLTHCGTRTPQQAGRDGEEETSSSAGVMHIHPKGIYPSFHTCHNSDVCLSLLNLETHQVCEGFNDRWTIWKSSTSLGDLRRTTTVCCHSVFHLKVFPHSPVMSPTCKPTPPPPPPSTSASPSTRSTIHRLHSASLSLSFLPHLAVSFCYSHTYARSICFLNRFPSLSLTVPPCLRLSGRSGVIWADVSAELIIPSSCCLPTTSLLPLMCRGLSFSLPLLPLLVTLTASFLSTSFTLSCRPPSFSLSFLPARLRSHPLNSVPLRRPVRKIQPLVHEQSDVVLSAFICVHVLHAMVLTHSIQAVCKWRWRGRRKPGLTTASLWGRSRQEERRTWRTLEPWTDGWAEDGRWQRGNEGLGENGCM